MVDEPFEYDASQINWLRPPDVEGEVGAWQATWLLQLGDDGPAATSSIAPLRAALDSCSITLTGLGDGAVRLVTHTPEHPLHVDGFDMIDQILGGLDAALGGVAEINGSPRAQWRTFRSDEALADGSTAVHLSRSPDHPDPTDDTAAGR